MDYQRDIEGERRRREETEILAYAHAHTSVCVYAHEQAHTQAHIKKGIDSQRKSEREREMIITLESTLRFIRDSRNIIFLHILNFYNHHTDSPPRNLYFHNKVILEYISTSFFSLPIFFLTFPSFFYVWYSIWRT